MIRRLERTDPRVAPVTPFETEAERINWLCERWPRLLDPAHQLRKWRNMATHEHDEWRAQAPEMAQINKMLDKIKQELDGREGNAATLVALD